MLLFFLVPFLDIVLFSCLLVHSTSYAGLCLCVRAVAGWALCKHKKYFFRCRSRDVEVAAERKLLMSNSYFAEYPQITSRHLVAPWIDTNSVCVSRWGVCASFSSLSVGSRLANRSCSMIYPVIVAFEYTL